MVRVLLIVAVAACSGSAPAPVTPAAPLGSAAVPESLWDKGTFVAVDKDAVDPDHMENFEIFQTASGYRLSIEWKRRMPTGQMADGSIEFQLDSELSPLAGEDVMTIHETTGKEVTRSTLLREPDGRLTTEVISASGEKSTNTSKGPNDWFLGSRFTSFLFVMCQAGAAIEHPVVYPDKATDLARSTPVTVEGTPRTVTVRRLTYAVSQTQVIAACEDGKLAGELTRGVTIVRKDDIALARTLAAWFR